MGVTRLEEITAKDFELASCQATLFTPDEEVSSARLTKTLVPRWIERFDADPVVLPSQEAMPREIPRVILHSRSGTWRCEIASARINLFWRGSAVEVSVPTLTGFYKRAIELLNEYSNFLDCRIGRLAAVINRFAKHDSPGLFLANHFCKRNWLRKALNRPENYELHAHKRFLLAETFEVNSWVRSKTGTFSSTSGHEKIVLVEQDLNTLAEQVPEASFTQEEIEDFFESVVSEFDVILRLYYPERKGRKK